MVIFRWNPDLSTGIELIDKQHRMIIKNANAFFICHKCGNDKAAVEKCLSFLQSYILYHFQTEEAFQSDCSYPHYRQHQSLHTNLATKVKFLTVQLSDSNYAKKDVEQFYQFLCNWVCEHIMVEDLDFAKYYKEAKNI